jgi:hypothetical protein
MRKTALLGVAILGLLLPVVSSQVQIAADRDKAFHDVFTLIADSDLHCSFFVLEEEPKLRIAAGETGVDKMLLADGDLFYFKADPDAGLTVGQALMILEIGPKVRSFSQKTRLGPVAFRRGRARVIRFDKDYVVARVDKSCGPVTAGNALVPFVEKEGLLGRDLGFEGPLPGGESVGRIVFFDNEMIQIGSGQWALIDIGLEQGLYVGQQLTIAHRAAEGFPLEAIANAVVIDAGRLSSTIKVLSAKTVVGLGDPVFIK